VAVFLSASAQITPLSLLHWMKIGQILHEKVVILTLITDPQPRVAAADRIRVIAYGEELYGVEAHYGYMDEPDIEKLEPALRAAIVLRANQRVYYFLGREILIHKRSYRWEPVVYRWLARNSRPASEFLHIPPGQMIEIGAAIHV
jgi:KUP system potassium uptake protein